VLQGVQGVAADCMKSRGAEEDESALQFLHRFSGS